VTFDVRLTITGVQQAQAANLRWVAALRPTGALGEAVRTGTTMAHRYAVIVTHVDTGTLRASHRVAVTGLRGRVYIAPDAVNPRSGRRAAVYGPFEHGRGGDHAFYRRVVDEYGREIERAMGGQVKVAMR